MDNVLPARSGLKGRARNSGEATIGRARPAGHRMRAPRGRRQQGCGIARGPAQLTLGRDAVFDVDTLIADCVAARSEADAIRAVKDVLDRALSKPGEMANAL